MALSPKKRIATLSETQSLRRAVANTRLEGGMVSAEQLALIRQRDAGRLTRRELIEKSRARATQA